LNDLPELFFIQAETTEDALAHIGARSLAFIVMDPSLHPDLRDAAKDALAAIQDRV
jgi:hypothetical protein